MIIVHVFFYQICSLRPVDGCGRNWSPAHLRTHHLHAHELVTASLFMQISATFWVEWPMTAKTQMEIYHGVHTYMQILTSNSKTHTYLEVWCIFVSLRRYLDDFYELELQAQSGVKGWSIPETKGGGPSARESHSSVVYCSKGGGSPKLYIFGGMCGHRLNDLWQLDIGKALFIFTK